MKKIATILIALIATVSVSFAATSGPSTDYSRGNWSTQEIQAVSQEVVAPANADAQVPGLYSTYSIDNTLIDTTAFNRSTNLEGFLAQVDQAQYAAMDTNIAASADANVNASQI
jgi:hypothetical protein